MSRNKGFQMRDLNQYRVNRAGEEEYLRQTFYDFQDYAAAGQQQLLFFQVPKGQSGKTIADTNMETAGTLPQPKYFRVQSIEIQFFPGVNPVQLGAALAASEFTNDVYTVAKSGSLKFFIGSKAYLEEAPIGRFPPKTRLETEFAATLQRSQAAAADAEDQITMDYAAFAGRPYRIEPEILLEPTQNFVIELNWPAAVALPSGVAGRIGVVMDGILIRNSQ